MSKIFNGYCLIYEEEIGEGICVEIIHELMELKKEEYLTQIKKKDRIGITNDGIYEICKSCPNSPEEWKD